MKKITSLMLVCILAFALVGCGSKNSSNSDELFPNNTINVGYISYPPGFIIDPNTGAKSGIFNDILVEIAKRNGLTINYKEEVTWATMTEVLNIGRVDLIANPVWKTADRVANADFSNAVYFSPIGIYVRADDNRFDSDFSKINDSSVKIVSMNGEEGIDIANSDYPQADLVTLPNNTDYSQLFMDVADGKEDVVFAEPMVADDYLKSNPGTLKNIAEGAPIRVFGDYFMYEKVNTKVGDFLNAQLAQLIQDGTVDNIISKYASSGDLIGPTDPLAVEKDD